MVVEPHGVRRADVLVVDGEASQRSPSRVEPPSDAIVLDASGCAVGPGLVDLHAHLREPGGEEAETIASATRAGRARRVHRRRRDAQHRRRRATRRRSSPRSSSSPVARAATWRSPGRSPSGDVARRSRPWRRSPQPASRCSPTTARACSTATSCAARSSTPAGSASTCAQHCEDATLAAGGVMHEGTWSSTLGLRGQPALAETAVVARDLGLVGAHRRADALPAPVGARVGATRRRGARSAGCPSPARWPRTTSPLDDARCAEYDPTFKVNPPLRPAALRDELVALLREGAIDAVATDHAPHPPEAKDRPFDGRRVRDARTPARPRPHGRGARRPDVGATSSPLFALLSRRPAAIARLRGADPTARRARRARRRPRGRHRRQPVRRRPRDAAHRDSRVAREPIAQHPVRRSHAAGHGAPHGLPRRARRSATGCSTR